jgi:hypothetical protein
MLWPERDHYGGLNNTQEHAFWRPEQDLAATLYDGTVSSPLAQQTACGERGDVRRARQLLICGVNLNTAWNFLANNPCQTNQNMSKSLASRIAS